MNFQRTFWEFIAEFPLKLNVVPVQTLS